MGSRSLGLRLKYNSVLLSFLCSPEVYTAYRSDTLYDNAVLIPEEITGAGHAAERSPLGRAWIGGTSLYNVWGCSRHLWHIKQIICCFLLVGFTLNNLVIAMIIIKHLRALSRLWFLSAMNPIKHNTRATIIQARRKPEDRQEVLGRNNLHNILFHL